MVVGYLVETLHPPAHWYRLQTRWQCFLTPVPVSAARPQCHRPNIPDDHFANACLIDRAGNDSLRDMATIESHIFFPRSWLLGARPSAHRVTAWVYGWRQPSVGMVCTRTRALGSQGHD